MRVEESRKETINLKMTKGKRHTEKIAKDEVKLARMTMREAKKAFDASWSGKCCVEVGDTLHNAIKNNVPIQSKALIMGDLCNSTTLVPTKYVVGGNTKKAK